jgi:SMI1/KNR4 family protein SUKH-1
MTEPNRFWDVPYPYGPELPPVSADQLRRWEKRFGVRLPQVLAQALMIQNGGALHGTGLSILPLVLTDDNGRIEGSESYLFMDREQPPNLHVGEGGFIYPPFAIWPMSSPHFDLAFDDDRNAEFGDRARLFVFAHQEYGGTAVLDYNDRAEPRVLMAWPDLGMETRPAAESFDALLALEREAHRPKSEAEQRAEMARWREERKQERERERQNRPRGPHDDAIERAVASVGGKLSRILVIKALRDAAQLDLAAARKAVDEYGSRQDPRPPWF